MARQLPFLRGLAILAVVASHAVGWGYTAMFWWVDQYSSLVPPDFSPVGSLRYYVLSAVQQFTLFSVPAFLFICGFFMTYAARGRQGVGWKVVRGRISNLLWPYLIWTAVVFVGNALQGRIYTPLEYLRQVLVGEATGAYFFVPLLCQFYLISPWVVPIGKDRPVMLLIGTAVAQALLTGICYLQLGGIRLPGTVFQGGWLFVRPAFFFALGIAVGFHSGKLRAFLTRSRWLLLGTTIILGALSVLESEWLYRATTPLFGDELFGWAHSWVKFSSTLYGTAFLLTFLAFSVGKAPFWRTMDWLGKRSYGVYLLHSELLVLLSRVTYHGLPQLLARQVTLVGLLLVMGTGIPLLVMEGVSRSPLKRVYHYLFG